MVIEAKATHQKQKVHFDLDFYDIGINNRYLVHILHDLKNLISLLVESNRIVKGFYSSHVTNVKRGIIMQRQLDNKGYVHAFKILNSYYTLLDNMYLLSSQNKVKEMNVLKLVVGTYYVTTVNDI